MISFLPFVLAAYFGFVSVSFADTEVRFTNRELDAGFVLMRPELNSLEIDGKRGVFTPAPSIRYLGVEHEEFAIDLGTLANIADLHFNHVKSGKLQVAFENGLLRITVPVQDQDRAVESRLGSISLYQVSLSAFVGWTTYANGSQELELKYTQFDGALSGTGILHPNWVLAGVRNLMLKVLTRELGGILGNPSVQDSIQKGLLQWGKFYSGTEVAEVTPGSVHMITGDSASSAGFAYQVK